MQVEQGGELCLAVKGQLVFELNGTSNEVTATWVTEVDWWGGQVSVANRGAGTAYPADL